MSKHLKTIQIFAKIARVLSIIVFVCSIIGACGCVIGLTALGFLGNSEFAELIFEEAQFNLDSAILGAISGLIWCVAEIITSYMAMKYFKRELEAGTPFTYDGAQELFRVGLFATIVPVAASIVDSIVFACFVLIDKQVIESDFSSSFDIGLGITLIVVSVLCKHGAELAEKAQQATSQEQYEVPVTESQEQPEESQN